MKMQGHFPGIYSGTVFDDNDPEQIGRIKAIVPEVGFEDGSKTTEWAYPKATVLGGNLGVFVVPGKKARVWIEFRNGDPNIPIYDGGHWSKPGGANEIPGPAIEADPSFSDSKFGDDADPRYPNNKVFKTSAGHLIEIDDTPGKERIRIFHKSGSQIQFRIDGSVNQRVKKKWTVEVDQDFILRSVLGGLLDGGDAGGTSKTGIVTNATYPVDYLTGLPIGRSMSLDGSS